MDLRPVTEEPEINKYIPLTKEEIARNAATERVQARLNQLIPIALRSELNRQYEERYGRRPGGAKDYLIKSLRLREPLEMTSEVTPQDVYGAIEEGMAAELDFSEIVAGLYDVAGIQGYETVFSVLEDMHNSASEQLSVIASDELLSRAVSDFGQEGNVTTHHTKGQDTKHDFILEIDYIEPEDVRTHSWRELQNDEELLRRHQQRRTYVTSQIQRLLPGPDWIASIPVCEVERNSASVKVTSTEKNYVDALGRVVESGDKTRLLKRKLRHDLDEVSSVRQPEAWQYLQVFGRAIISETAIGDEHPDQPHESAHEFSEQPELKELAETSV